MRSGMFKTGVMILAIGLASSATADLWTSREDAARAARHLSMKSMRAWERLNAVQQYGRFAEGIQRLGHNARELERLVQQGNSFEECMRFFMKLREESMRLAEHFDREFKMSPDWRVRYYWLGVESAYYQLEWAHTQGFLPHQGPGPGPGPGPGGGGGHGPDPKPGGGGHGPGGDRPGPGPR